jgi:hypothetical protein
MHDDPTRPPYEYNTTPEDVVAGLLSDSVRIIDDRIHVSVEELLAVAILGIKVRRESVTKKVLDLLNLRASMRMGLKGVDPSALVEAECLRRKWQQQTSWPVVIEQDGPHTLTVRTRGN